MPEQPAMAANTKDTQIMNAKNLLFNIDHRGVATISLNRPERHNAFDDQLIAELTQVLEQVASDNQVRAVVLASEGKSFSAGADLHWMQRMAQYSFEENLADASALGNLLRVLNFLPKPTIARVQGAAFGGAVGLVSCCDIAVASVRAKFCLSEVKIGIVPATISPYVIAAIGQRAARRYFVTAEPFDAATAAQLGLVSKVVEESELDAVVNRMLEQLLANSPAAICAAKKLVFEVAEQPIDDALIARTSELIAGIRVSDEGQEGLSAFLEKRTPSWLRNK